NKYNCLLRGRENDKQQSNKTTNNSSVGSVITVHRKCDFSNNGRLTQMSMQLQQVYDISAPSVAALGLVVIETQLNRLLQGPVNDILQDNTGKEELTDLLNGLATTDFEQAELEAVLNLPTVSDYEDWLIGEALAEVLLVENDGCSFPWPTSRDLKNPSA